MKTTELLVKLIKKLEADKRLKCTTVINVILHAYELECALEVTFKEFDEWLELAANLAQYDDDWFEEQWFLYLFRSKLVEYCQNMPLWEAIEELKNKYYK